MSDVMSDVQSDRSVPEVSAGRVAFARSLSAGRTVMSLVAIVAALSASSWREPLSIDVSVLIIGTAGFVLLRELTRLVRRRIDQPDPVMIVVDAGLAVAILAVIGDAAGPLGWVAMAVPVLEALVWSGVIAAALTWIAVGGSYVVLRVMAGAEIDSILLDLVRHLGGSVLIAVPGWAAGSVLGRELDAAQMTGVMARARAENVQRLAEAGRQLAAADSTEAVINELVRAGIRLGFSAADVVVQRDGAPRVERLGGSFAQGTPRASFMTDLAIERGVVGTNPTNDAQALHRCGLRSGAAARITEKGARVVVRLWRTTDVPPGVDDLETVRMLAAQAAVAWHQASTRAELEERAATLAHRASHDALTGLANRSGLLAYLDGAGYDMGGQLALLFIDLDGFKAVNDTLGHDVGDEVLRSVAHRLSCSVGDGFVARLGGDEFVVVVGVDTIETGAAIGKRLIESLESPFETAVGAELSGSVGVALIDGSGDVHETMRLADQAMYAAKRAGGGRVAAARSGAVPQ